MRFGHMLVDKPYGLTISVNVIRHRIYLFREGERKWLPLKSMILPVSIRCSTCANRMPQGTTLTYVRRRALSKTSLGAPIITFFFSCTKCRANIQMKEDPENSGHVVEDGATKFFEHEKLEHLGKMIEASPSIFFGRFYQLDNFWSCVGQQTTHLKELYKLLFCVFDAFILFSLLFLIFLMNSIFEVAIGSSCYFVCTGLYTNA